MRILGAMNEAQTRASARFMMTFSKAWNSGDRIRVFYPVANLSDNPDNPMYDVIVSSMWGHKIDVKSVPNLKRVFIPCAATTMSTGQVLEPDYLCRMAGLCKLLLKAQQKAEENRIAKSKLAGSAKDAALKTVAAKYDNLRPLVGYRSYVISTNCFVVKLLPTGAPDLQNARMCVQDLSDTRIQKLHDIIKDNVFNGTVKDGYLEVQYTFGSTGSKSQDGRADPQGIGHEGILATTFPREWETLQSSMRAGLPKDSTVIAGRDQNRVPVDERLLRKSLGDVLIGNAGYFEEFDPIADMADIQQLARHRDTLKELDITISAYDLEEAAGTQEEHESPVEEEIANALVDNMGGVSEEALDLAGGELELTDAVDASLGI